MMRQRITRTLLETFMQEAASAVTTPARIYLTGGSTAVLLGFRAGTIDIDVSGDLDELFSEIPNLKTGLNINIELAKPTDFVPGLPGEKRRHLPIRVIGAASFFHFDPYGQAFSKVVRGHATDISDARDFVRHELVDPHRLFAMVSRLPPEEFHRYPRLDPESVVEAVRQFAKYCR